MSFKIKRLGGLEGFIKLENKNGGAEANKPEQYICLTSGLLSP
nr:hypothetical protein [Bacteroides propionicifaciens]